MKRKTSQVPLNDHFNCTRFIDQPNVRLSVLLMLVFICLTIIHQASAAQEINPKLSAKDLEDTVPLMLVNLQSVNIRCSESRDGQITMTVSGGKPPYSYSIPGVIIQTDSVIKHLEAAKYTCRITDSNGDAVEGIITVKKEWRYCSVFVPSAFSPNNDGLNDIFKVKIQDDISDFHMQVFDRWGHMVYEGNDPAKGWDGTQGSIQALPAVYLWSITYTDNKKQPTKQQGTVTLVR
jgi:gliding motility-associated-like protein